MKKNASTSCRNFIFRPIKSGIFWKSLGAITLLAWLLRLLVCWQLRDLTAVNTPSAVTDMATYQQLALQIRQGNFPKFYDYQPFYYAVFLPIVWLFSPTGAVWLVFFAQSLIGAATVWLTGISAARIMGRKAGLLAATLLCLSRFHIFYTPFMLLEVLQAFWLALIVYLGLRAWKTNHLGWWFALGLSLGCATLTRGNALLLLPGTVFMLVQRNWSQKTWGHAALALLLLLLMFEAPQLPFAIRNYHYTGHWTGPSIAGNKVLILGNSPEAPDGGLEYPRTYHYWCHLDTLPEDKRVPALRSILNWGATAPLCFGELIFRKLLLFWSNLEIPNNISINYEGSQSFLLKHIPLVPFGLLAATAICGFFALLGRWRNNGACWLLHIIIMLWLSIAAFYILARFRICALPPLAMASGIGLATLLKACAQRRQNKIRFQYYLLALTFGAFVQTAYGTYQSYFLPAVQRWLTPQGTALSFPSEKVVYDHGPLAFGGSALLELPTAPKPAMRLKKFFLVPADWPFPQASENKLHVLLRFHGNPLVASTLITPEGQHISGSHFADRQTTWFDFSLPETAWQPGEPFSCEFLLSTSGQSNTAIYIDKNRNYGRTRFWNPDTDGWETADFELTAELVLK